VGRVFYKTAALYGAVGLFPLHLTGTSSWLSPSNGKEKPGMRVPRLGTSCLFELRVRGGSVSGDRGGLLVFCYLICQVWAAMLYREACGRERAWRSDGHGDAGEQRSALFCSCP